MVLLFINLLPGVLATTTYTPTTKTVCDTTCKARIFTTIKYAQNSNGEWVSPSEVIYITKNQDDITFHYNGMSGYFNITFESGVIYNGNYYSFSQVKQSYPEITFDFPQEDHGTYHKYAVNITNLDELDTNLIGSITLTYKDHYGFTIDQLDQGDRWFNIKNTMALYFEDLLENHQITINKSEKRLYIHNITERIIDGSLYLDPTVRIGTTETFEDTYNSEAAPNGNYGASAELYIGTEVGDTFFESIIKFNQTIIPNGSYIKNAVLSFKKVADDYLDNIVVKEYDNQTWAEYEMTYNKLVRTDIGSIIDTIDSSSYTNRLNFTVTSWVQNQVDAERYNISFYINITNMPVGANYLRFNSKESAGNEPFLDVEYEFAEYGINVSVFDAHNTTIVPDWNITFNNGTDNVTFLENTNFKLFPVNETPTGLVNITIWRDGYGNATYQDISIDGLHMENFTAFIFDTSRGLLDIVEPQAGSLKAGLQVPLNITVPSNMTSTVDLSYSINGSAYQSLCTSCNGFIGNISIANYGQQNLTVRAHSPIYLTYGEQSEFTSFYAVYNISIFDELRNVSMDFSLVDYANLTVFCPSDTIKKDITSPSFSNLYIDCTFEEIRLSMKLLNQTSEHFRTLIPLSNTGNITFWMMDNITKDPETNFVDVKITLDDLSGIYANGYVVIRKIINHTEFNLIEQKLDSENAIEAYLIINERYRLYVQSADRTLEKYLRIIYVRNLADNDKRISLKEQELFPEIYDAITWSFGYSIPGLYINFTYDDIEDLTNSVTFQIYNITRKDNESLIYSITQSGSALYFIWTDADMNNTYRAEFIADHQVLDEIKQDTIFSFFLTKLYGLPLLELFPIWYQIISIMIIMVTALLFGARVAPWGAVVVAIEAGFLAVIGWLNINVAIITLIVFIAIISLLGYRRGEQ